MWYLTVGCQSINSQEDLLIKTTEKQGLKWQGQRRDRQSKYSSYSEGSGLPDREVRRGGSCREGSQLDRWKRESRPFQGSEEHI